MEVEYLTVLSSDQNKLSSDAAHSVDTEHIYPQSSPSGDEELQQTSMQCIIADSVGVEYLPNDQSDLYSNATYRVDTGEDEYEVLQKRLQCDLQTYSACNNDTQPTAAVNSHSELDRNTDTNSHIDVNTCSPTYDSHTIVNAGLPTYSMSETRQQADVSVLYIINTEHHPDTDTNYSQIEDLYFDLNDPQIYCEDLSVASNTVSKHLSFIRR